MALASILYTDGSFKKVELDKAIKAYEALTGVTEPTPEQADWLCTIKRIFLPPSARPSGYMPASQASGIVPVGYDPKTAVTDTTGVPEGDMYHQGILQGSNQALPRNDRD